MYSFLIVDDEPIIRKGLQVILKNSDLTISMIKEAGNGEEALGCLAQEEIDILVTDIKMPKMDGLKLCQKVQILYPKLIVLIISGYDDFKYAQQAIAFGVKEYILKPVDEIAFIKAVHHALERNAIFNQNNHISIDKIDGLIGSLEKILWEGFDPEIDRVGLDLDEMFRGFPLNYTEITLKEILELTIKRISGRLGYPLKIALPQFKGHNKQEFQLWLAKVLPQIKEEVFAVRTVQGFELIDLAKQLLEEDCNISLEDLSRKVGMSPNYFSATFKEKTGKTFIEYRTELKMKKATELLCQPVKSITDITFEVGYTDITHFTRTFKKHTGVTPSEFREQRGLR